MTVDLTRLKQLALSDSGFVFDPITGHTFTLNATAMRTLNLLKEGHSPPDVAALLADQFEVDGSEDLQRDVEDFLSRLREHGLVT